MLIPKSIYSIMFYKSLLYFFTWSITHSTYKVQLACNFEMHVNNPIPKEMTDKKLELAHLVDSS